MTDLYPQIQPYAIHRLAVDDLHTLYVEECGNPRGLPVVFLHGGPGAGCEPYHRRFFDPRRYHIVLFDQRGCGRSTPHASLNENTTSHLIEDVERVRKMFGIGAWLVFGGSWGSTLALAYAEAHRQAVLGLVLRGIFLCRDEEIRWFYQDGANRVFPDYWRDFVAPIPVEERHELVAAFYRRLTSSDELARMAAAKAWSVWEGRAATLLPNTAVVQHFGRPRTAMSVARIECHYFINQAFLEPNQLLRDAHRIADLPGVIVQGRYDLICPMRSAWELHQAWPLGELQIVPDAGHSAGEPGILGALVAATDRFVERLG